MGDIAEAVTAGKGKGKGAAEDDVEDAEESEPEKEKKHKKKDVSALIIGDSPLLDKIAREDGI